MDSKLTDTDAENCGGQLLQALERIGARHDWSNGDLIAVTLLAFNELLCRSVGPTQAVAFYRDHADGLEAEHLKRAGI
jgi:hypothetical protein